MPAKVLLADNGLMYQPFRRARACSQVLLIPSPQGVRDQRISGVLEEALRKGLWREEIFS